MKRNAPRFFLAVSLFAMMAMQAFAQTENAPQETSPPAPSAQEAVAEEASAALPSAPSAPTEEGTEEEPSLLDRRIAHSASECWTTDSEITTLREPLFGKDSAWDVVYSQDGMDVFSDAVALDNNIVIAAGSYTKDKKDTVFRPLLVKYDDRLKPLWEVREDTKDIRTIHRMIATKDGITVLGDIGDAKKGEGIYISSYDFDGKVRGKPVPLYESGGHLDAKAFVQARDGSGYLIAAQYVSDANHEEQHGMLYKVSRSGNLVWKRSFKTGQSTVFNSVQAALDGQSYIVTGQMVLDNKKSGGWLLIVDGDGAVKWQKTYPRGLAASIQAASQTKDGAFILSGKSRPSGKDTEQGLAAWVIKTDPSGNMLWQRFFKGRYSYEAPDLVAYEDGRASVLISGEGLAAGYRSHARLITFSPQGRIQNVEDFTEGQNAMARKIVNGAGGERMIVGYAQTTFGEKQEGNDAASAPVYTYDGWILAAVALDLYKDPCVSKPPESPILD